MKEIVIKIDDGIYKLIMSMDKALATTAIRPRIFDAIRNGKVLPKGHGRLIDESEITSCEWNGYLNYMTTNAPTIIEANKTESEE
ncbi:MAG: hypothetical protein IKN43_14545 [Selenomonadaceae bacterium]|nr:hypothetical protein [Selenomonadaceae bacterium]